MQPLPEVINVLLVHRPNAQRREQVEAIAPGRIRVTEIASRDFAADAGELWPAQALRQREPSSTRAERDRAAAEAHVVLLDLPYPTVLAGRTKDLRWLHHPVAGASNLQSSDIWGAGDPVQVTTARGSNFAGPIAESAIAGILMFARGLHHAARGSRDRRDYGGMVSIAGKTVGIVGLGGIGAHAAMLARGLGMRVIATRRSATARTRDIDGVDELFPTSDLHAMLGESDYVIVTAMLTRETAGMLDAAAFAAMKEGAVIVNVARGEIIDEPAMIAALDSGRLAGAYLDVYNGENAGRPAPAELVEHPKVVYTPHITPTADNPGRMGWDVFLDNLRCFVEGRPLENVVDWERGY